MGRKAFFTEEQVFAAADALATEGREVTATNLLHSLGGGSLTTIYKHLEAWQKARPAANVSPTLVSMPEVVQNAFATAWKAAAQEATREVSLIREQAKQEVKAAHKQFQEALDAISRLETDGEADSSRIEGLGARVLELEETIRGAQSDAAAAKATAEQLAEQLKSREQASEKLQQQLDNRTQELQKERDASMQEAAELRGQVELLKVQNSELITRVSGKNK